MCDLAHVLWLEQVKEEALADRQAQKSVAFAERWGEDDYTPISVAGRQAAFNEWLDADPSDSPEARAEAQAQRLMGVA